MNDHKGYWVWEEYRMPAKKRPNRFRRFVFWILFDMTWENVE